MSALFLAPTSLLYWGWQADVQEPLKRVLCNARVF